MQGTDIHRQEFDQLLLSRHIHKYQRADVRKNICKLFKCKRWLLVGVRVEEHVELWNEGRVIDYLHVAEQSLVILYFEEGVVVLVAEGAIIYEYSLKLVAIGVQLRPRRFHFIIYLPY